MWGEESNEATGDERYKRIEIGRSLVLERRDSIEHFTQGARPELARKEAAEIEIIERYLPKAVSEAEIAGTVRATIAEMASPGIREMGTVMKNVMAKFQQSGARVEGKMVSEIVKRELTSKT